MTNARPFRTIVAFLEFVGGLTQLLGRTLALAPAALFSKRGRRLGWHNLWQQMDRVGVKSVPIVLLVLFCIGAIRELGPLVSAIVLTGFAGASIAAEMGTMVVSEEIEALEAHAINPVRFLVVPRVLATTVMMVCIAILGDVAGVAGGLTVTAGFMGISPQQYWTHTFSILKLQDFVTGLVKAGMFGMLIAGLACYLGLKVTGGAQGVGTATTRTVVYTIVALIFVDLLFTGVFYYLGF